jgi:PTH2 family peptidyl-tRNA hydrolase
MVIVIRKDLKMRTGKACSQASHASMAFITKNFSISQTIDSQGDPCFFACLAFTEEINHWLRNSFRKICVYVNSEEELEAVHQKALDSGLISHMIVDNGATEFNGVKTKTCCAIGPASDHKFKNITDHLPLL